MGQYKALLNPKSLCQTSVEHVRWPCFEDALSSSFKQFPKINPLLFTGIVFFLEYNADK